MTLEGRVIETKFEVPEKKRQVRQQLGEGGLFEQDPYVGVIPLRAETTPRKENAALSLGPSEGIFHPIAHLQALII